jgi:hypothetical protein
MAGPSRTRCVPNSVTKRLCYDQLNRLTDSALAVSGASLSSCTSSGTNIIDNSVSYDEIGDILTKSDVGTYSYPSAGSAQPHGVASINTTTGCTLASCTVAGASNPIYQYDANGNVTCASTAANCTGTKIRQITYSAANMTTKAKESTAYTYSFTYNPEHPPSLKGASEEIQVTGPAFSRPFGKARSEVRKWQSSKIDARKAAYLITRKGRDARPSS